MTGSYYVVNGVTVMFVKFELLNNNNIRIFTSEREYTYPYSDMPEILETWQTVDDGFHKSFDHFAAEQQSNESLPVQQPDPPPLTPEQHLQSHFIGMLQTFSAQSTELTKKLNETIQNLKSDKGEQYVGRAKQIINAINAITKLRDSDVLMFKAGVDLMKMQDKKDKGKSKEAD